VKGAQHSRAKDGGRWGSASTGSVNKEEQNRVDETKRHMVGAARQAPDSFGAFTESSGFARGRGRVGGCKNDHEQQLPCWGHGVGQHAGSRGGPRTATLTAVLTYPHSPYLSNARSRSRSRVRMGSAGGQHSWQCGIWQCGVRQSATQNEGLLAPTCAQGAHSTHVHAHAQKWALAPSTRTTRRAHCPKHSPTPPHLGCLTCALPQFRRLKAWGRVAARGAGGLLWKSTHCTVPPPAPCLPPHSPQPLRRSPLQSTKASVAACLGGRNTAPSRCDTPFPCLPFPPQVPPVQHSPKLTTNSVVVGRTWRWRSASFICTRRAQGTAHSSPCAQHA